MSGCGLPMMHTGCFSGASILSQGDSYTKGQQLQHQQCPQPPSNYDASTLCAQPTPYPSHAFQQAAANSRAPTMFGGDVPKVAGYGSNNFDGVGGSAKYCFTGMNYESNNRYTNGMTGGAAVTGPYDGHDGKATPSLGAGNRYDNYSPGKSNAYGSSGNVYGNSGANNHSFVNSQTFPGAGGHSYSTTGYPNGGIDGSTNEYGDYDGNGCYGWRQEYSAGKVPAYQAEELWKGEAAAADSSLHEVHVFGPKGEQVPDAVTSFEAASELFPHQIIQRMTAAGFTHPTPIQAHTWAIAAAGRDVIGIAKTGSGKTLAFLLPGLLKALQSRTRTPTLCVLAPTRELACQIEAEAQKFGTVSGIRTACCYGGAPRGQQLGALRRGAQVVVACPGRLNDFLESNAVQFHNVSYLVLDEADRMLDMGFEPQIRQIVAQIPPQRQTLLFTATWPRGVRSLASEFLQAPIHVQTGSDDELTCNQDIEQHVFFVNTVQEKVPTVLEILSGLTAGGRCLIFCEMKRSAEGLATELVRQHAVPAVRIHGDMVQYERTAALESFKSGQRPVMVATDVAARGIDVKGVTLVINYDASSSAKDYVHRIGRTGRAGQKGTAYTLLLPTEERKAQDIIQVLRHSDMPIPPELQHLDNRRSGRGFGGGKGKRGKGSSKGGSKGGKCNKGNGKGKGMSANVRTYGGQRFPGGASRAQPGSSN